MSSPVSISSATSQKSGDATLSESSSSPLETTSISAKAPEVSNFNAKSSSTWAASQKASCSGTADQPGSTTTEVPAWVASLDREAETDQRAQPWRADAGDKVEDRHYLAYQPWDSAAAVDPYINYPRPQCEYCGGRGCRVCMCEYCGGKGCQVCGAPITFAG
ncbi:hypothetical protein BDW74DRAFT_96360 [Aspergillus multicolor]|uniref:uncharacterized protein n=1 Tax=Aspergillus multicolor TaxID=41759 RepID=UPI003CCE2984